MGWVHHDIPVVDLMLNLGTELDSDADPDVLMLARERRANMVYAKNRDLFLDRRAPFKERIHSFMIPSASS